LSGKNGARVAASFVKGAALVVHDGPPPLVHRDGKFATKHSKLHCSYFEIWKPAAANKVFLDRAYFTLKFADRSTENLEDVLCIHTDPDDSNVLKQCIHLHVIWAKYPIPKCHFPFDYSSLSQVLQNCSSLTEAMSRAMHLVATEVIEQFE
jgi:hypothetical protein